jgi:lipid-A-disaccharide synthase
MLAQGVQSIFPLEDLIVMGFIEVIPHLKRLFAKRDELVEVAKRENIDLLITIDFQDFNASLAKKVKVQCKVPCVHYVSPTVWAWRRGRIHKMATYLDHLLALFPFEPEMYYGSGLNCSFVGHPIAQQMKGMSRLSEQVNQKAIAENKAKVQIALLPGSRTGLIKKLLPTMLDAYNKLNFEGKVSGLCIPVAHDDHKALITELGLEKGIKPEDINFVSGESRFESLAQCKAALVASGTSNLELAMLGIPMLVVYQLNSLSYWLLKPFVKAPYASPVNWVAGKKIIPELLQHEFTRDEVLENLRPLLIDSVRRSQQLVELKQVREALGESQDVDASVKAANIVAEFLL